MDVRANKLKQSETAKYQRLPSPMSYIQNYNKVCSEESEQTKQSLQIDRKHGGLFLWNDGYVQLNRIKVPAILEERKLKRRQFNVPSTNNNSSSNNVLSTNGQTNPTQPATAAAAPQHSTSEIPEDIHDAIHSAKNSKQARERQQDRELQLRTEKLQKLIESNNQKFNRRSGASSSSSAPQFLTLPSDSTGLFNGRGASSFLQMNSGATDIDLNKQRKYFSHTKQQMEELRNHLLTSQKISREIMDRKGLSLRKVLSSIPQDKLIRIVDSKQIHFQRIMNEKILPKKQFRLKSQISPRFTGENNYDAAHRPGTSNTLSSAINAASSSSRKPHFHATANAFFKEDQQQMDESRAATSNGMRLSNNNGGGKKGLNAIQHAQLIVSDERLNESTNASKPAAASSVVSAHTTTVAAITATLGDDGRKGDVDEDGLFYHKFPAKELSDLINEDEADAKVERRTAGSKRGELRIRSKNEVKSTLDRLHEIQATYKDSIGTSQPTTANGDDDSGGVGERIASVSFEPKTSLGHMLQHDDERDRAAFVNTLEQKQKGNEDKNFFNYSTYFYGKYSRKNNGLSTKLSNDALHENQLFHENLRAMIQQVDNN